MMIRSGSMAMVTIAVFGSLAAELDAQSITVGRSAESLAVHAPALGFIKGEPLAHLKDGRTVRVDLDLSVMPGPGGSAAAHGRRTFVLSYDLWEERFAVTLAGSPARSATHLTAAAAEAWCMEQLTIPIAALGRLGNEAPFWIRLEYRVLDADAASGTDDGGFTLRGLIDAFSRRPRPTVWTHSVEAGPFRLR